MLSELQIKNLALIENLHLQFDQGNNCGLVVMTGETGAGKSIMLRAIHLLSGGRGSSAWIRNGADACQVEALFELSPEHDSLLNKLEDCGFGRDTSVVIKRIISDSGRSRQYVNGSLATAKTVAELTSGMLNVASQHDHQQLLQANLHLDFVDTLGDLWQQRLVLADIFRSWQGKKEELAELRKQEQEKEQRRDFIKFQVDEIRDAAPEPGEDVLLAAEKKRLKNGEVLIKLSQESYRLLNYDLAGGLTQLRQNLGQLSSLDSDIAQLAEDISGFTFLAEDYARELRIYKDSLGTDPFRLDQVNERLDLLQQLKRKYGESLELILEFAVSSEVELRHLDNMDKEIAALESEVETIEKKMCGLAEKLSQKRIKTGQKMEKAMAAELSSLAFAEARFAVKWQDVEHTPEHMKISGWGRGEFFFSANPGEEARPLAKVASGGELSRLMLAMKCLLAKKDMVETVIFDEVDAGIGGEAAEAVARKIQELAVHHQVFCITHLPQIAARGTLHFQVSKAVDGGRTQTAVVPLSSQLRVQEIVRMLAGDSATEQTRAWAEELLAKGGASA